MNEIGKKMWQGLLGEIKMGLSYTYKQSIILSLTPKSQQYNKYQL